MSKADVRPFRFIDPRDMVVPQPYQPPAVPPPEPTDAWYRPFHPAVEHVAKIRQGKLNK